MLELRCLLESPAMLFNAEIANREGESGLALRKSLCLHLALWLGLD